MQPGLDQLVDEGEVGRWAKHEEGRDLEQAPVASHLIRRVDLQLCILEGGRRVKREKGLAAKAKAQRCIAAAAAATAAAATTTTTTTTTTTIMRKQTTWKET